MFARAEVCLCEAVSVVTMVTKGGGCAKGMCECGCLWRGNETKVEKDMVGGPVKAIASFGGSACDHRQSVFCSSKHVNNTRVMNAGQDSCGEMS